MDLQEGTSLKILNWNIQGLMNDELNLRTKAVIAVIHKENPDGILFQELVPLNFSEISKSLPDNYKGIKGSDAPYSGYFTGIFYNKDRLAFKNHQIVKYKNTVMDRTLLITKFSVVKTGTNIALLTTHLESLPHFKNSRVEQLKQCFKICDEFPPNYNVIFGGDLNLEENEEDDILIENVKDTWEECGSDLSTKYTWDGTINKNEKIPKDDPRPKTRRHDRIYFRSSTPETVRLRDFKLLGKELVEGTIYFPSDHWAIMLTIHLNDNSGTTTNFCKLL